MKIFCLLKLKLMRFFILFTMWDIYSTIYIKDLELESFCVMLVVFYPRLHLDRSS